MATKFSSTVAHATKTRGENLHNGSTNCTHLSNRSSFHIKEGIVDKVKNERNDWFTKVNTQSGSNVARKIRLMDIP